ncbi:MAG: DUF4331 family protein [Lysobacter sp.]
MRGRQVFAVNHFAVFDLITNPVGPPDAERNLLDDKNTTTIALEVPISWLSNGVLIRSWALAAARDVAECLGGCDASRLQCADTPTPDPYVQAR